jgi:hypothetical protein
VVSQRITGRREFCLSVFILFIYYQKTYNGLPKEELWHITRGENIPTLFVTEIQNLYKKNCTKCIPNKIQQKNPLGPGKKL